VASGPGIDRVERPHESRAGQELRGRHARAALARVLRHRAVARGIGIAGVEHDLARELLREILAELRSGGIRNGHHDDIAEERRLVRRADSGLRAERLRKLFEIFWVTGGDHHFVPGVRPEPRQGAADVTGADDADFHGVLACGRRRPRCLRARQRRDQCDRRDDAQGDAAHESCCVRSRRTLGRSHNACRPSARLALHR
jgi:hypothetical protein